MEFAFLAFASYGVFVFVAEQLNPFNKPVTTHRRKRRKLGISCASALFVAGLIGFAGFYDNTQLSVLTTLGLAAVFSAPYVIAYRKTR